MLLLDVAATATATALHLQVLTPKAERPRELQDAVELSVAHILKVSVIRGVQHRIERLAVNL